MNGQRQKLETDSPATAPLYQWGSLMQVAGIGFVWVLLVVAFALPYLRNNSPGYTGFVYWTGSNTPIWAYLVMLGLPFFLILTWYLLELIDWVNTKRQSDQFALRRFLPGFLILTGSLLGLGVASSRIVPVAGIAVPLLALSGFFYLKDGQSLEKRFVLMLIILGLALTLLVELITLQGDIGRMNTVFKFYLQVWFLLNISASLGLGWSLQTFRQWPRTLKYAWSGFLGLLVVLAALYPILATRAKVIDRWVQTAPHSLDGMLYMAEADRHENGINFSLEGDYYALRWLIQAYDTESLPVVLEAHTPEYRWGSRVAIYTGYPSVIGWNWHQRQQRPDHADEVWVRVGDVATAYNTVDVLQTMSILNIYDVDLIMVGGLERAYYNETGLEKFDTMVQEGYLRVVYDYADTRIYEVVR